MATRFLSRRLLPWQSLARPKKWVCLSCRGSTETRRRINIPPNPSSSSSSSSNNNDKPYYVTTPIFYVNAAPHIGHLYSMLLADVFKRYHMLRGRPAVLTTGTDEHGLKVQQAAALAEQHPKDLCDETAQKFEELAHLANVDYTRFIRTTDPDHIEAVEHVWRKLRDKGLIYVTKHEGWYSVSDECFYPESQIVRHQEPFTGVVSLVAQDTNSKVEWVEEKNYCFRLTALKDRLIEFYEQNPTWIWPARYRDEVLHWIKNNLQDLSISRPVQRLTWGIPVPEDPSQIIYVWVDALINYLTTTGYPHNNPLELWPADLHIIGKDILRFHGVYWPAILLALDLPPPRRMLVHSHWLLNKRKMSKSLGNVVHPLYAINRWGVDTVRFYLLSEGGIDDDASYNNRVLMERYKKQLQWGIGNLLGRVSRSKAWNLEEAVRNCYPADRPLAEGLDEVRQTAMASLTAKLESTPSVVDGYMNELNPVNALRHLLEVGAEMNKYMERTAPWSMASSPDRSVQEACQEVIFLAAEGLRITGILLQPFLPAKAGQLLDMLGVRQDWRTFEHAALRADPEYGRPFVSPGQSRVDALFPPLVEETDFKVGEKVGHNRDRIRRKKEKVEEEEKERLLGKKEEEVTTEVKTEEVKTEEVKKEEGSV